MISQTELLEIIFTEAVEHGGLQEVPGHKDGGTSSFHAAKREARGEGLSVDLSDPVNLPHVNYGLRLVRDPAGNVHWED